MESLRARALVVRTALVLVAACLAVATPLMAQADTAVAESCPADSTASGRVCQAGFDALTMLLPVEGILAGGGNPVPGTAAALGKFGKFRIGARVGFTSVTLPSSGYDGTSDTVQADKQLLVPMPRLDLSVGLLSKKLAMGTVAVDLLGSAVLLPTDLSSRYRVDATARKIGPLALGLGYGFRAAMDMGKKKPTVSLSVIKRDLPIIHFGDMSAGDQSSIATNLSAINVRLLVGGKMSFLTISAGGGMDLYKGDGTVSWRDQVAGTDSSIAVALSTSRLTATLNAAINLGPLSLWGEGGFQVGKAVEVKTIFEGVNPSAGRFYGGLGAALTF